MDAAQLKEYTDGMAVIETTRTLRRHHEQCIQALIRQTTPCDGTSVAGVRAWFKDIELAGGELCAKNQIEIAARNAAGLLRWKLERYITGVLATNDNIKNRFNVPWADVRAHLRTLFSMWTRAVPSEMRWRKRDRVPHNRILVRAFARGLCSDELACKLVEEGNPTTLEVAFTTLAGYSTRKDSYARLSRREEPIDVAPVNPAPTRPPDSTTDLLLKKLSQSPERLQTKVAKFEAQARSPRITTAPTTRPTLRDKGQRPPQGAVHEPGASWTSDGKPRCFGCSRVFHVHRECRKSRSVNEQKS